jgi:hypothetical protein
MDNRLKKPTNPYDPAWVAYAQQNPGLRRSLSAADAGDGDELDLGTFVPESFKGEDDKWDTAGFRASFDELTSFKAQADERIAALPQEAGGYAFEIPESHAFPEGFDPETMKTKDADGNDVEFDVKSMIQTDDPDLPLLQAAMLKHGADPALMGDVASILANRELRGVMDGMKEAEAETQKLGPEAKARFSTVERSLNSRMPAGHVKALMDGVISADGLRGLETLLKKAGPPVTSAGDKQDYSEMKPVDRVMAGIKERSSA